MKLINLLSTLNEADPPFAAGLPNVVQTPWVSGRGKREVDSVAPLMKHMAKHGYTYLGSGGYSKIFKPASGGNHVVKILKVGAMAPKLLDREEGVKDDYDDDYEMYGDFLCSVRWLRLAAKEDNPHFPVVHKVGTFEFPIDNKLGTKATAFYAVMEKLDPYDFSDLKVPYKKGSDDWLRYMAAILLYDSGPWGVKEKRLKDYIFELPELRNENIRRGWDEWESYLFVCRQNTQIPICDAMVKIFEFMTLVNCERDFKDTNVMMRNGVPVFTDPIEG